MKIAIVRCGQSLDYHISFAKHYPAVDIVGLVDKDQEKAQKCVAEYGIEKIYSNIQDLVDEQSPDAIHIVTPPNTH